MVKPLDSPWQERVIRRRGGLSVRAKLIWTLCVLLCLSLIPVVGSLVAIHHARVEVTAALGSAADTALQAKEAEVSRDLSLVLRNLVTMTGIVLVLALVVALTAPRWILKPLRQLTGLIHNAQFGPPAPGPLVSGSDEVARLARYLDEHLRRDQEVETLRRKIHRMEVRRLEALLEARSLLGAGVDHDNRLTFVSHRLRERLGIEGPASIALPLEEIWPDPTLLQAIHDMRQEGTDTAHVILGREPFEGKTAQLVRTRAGDPTEAEILVLVEEEPKDTPGTS